MVDIQEEAAQERRDCPTCGRSYDKTTRVCPNDGSVLTALDPLVGTVLADRYKVLSILGRGGMSIVYKARHQLMDRVVAIKMLHAQLVSDTSSLKRFQLEAKAVSALSHPNIILVYDFGITDAGLPYLVMDYLEGLSISDVIKEDGQLELVRGLNIFSQSCDALAHAHAKGVIHRDLKPSNIMLVQGEGEGDHVKVVDFGIAKLLTPEGGDAQKLTQTGEVVGSPLYMSPEQLLGHRLDARSDIYSMGCVIYESITGKPPFLGDNVIDTMRKHLDEMPTPLHIVRSDLKIPESIESIVRKALAKDPDNRYQSMSELKSDLDQAYGDLRGSLPPHLVRGPRASAEARGSRQQGEQNHLFLAFVVTIAVVLGVGTLWAVLYPKGPVQIYLASTHWEEYNQAADRLIQQNKFDEALRMTKLELKEAEKFPESDPRLARSLRNLGSLYQLKEDYHDAEVEFNRLLAVLTRTLGPNDPAVADCLDNLASVYNHEARYTTAENLWLRSLDIKKKALGMNDVQTSMTLNLLGKFYDEQHRYEKAEPLFKQALSIRQKVLKEADPETTLVLHNLALLYDHQKRYEEAEELYQRAIKLYRRTLPPDDPYLIAALEDYSDHLRATDRANEADTIDTEVYKLLHK